MEDTITTHGLEMLNWYALIWGYLFAASGLFIKTIMRKMWQLIGDQERLDNMKNLKYSWQPCLTGIVERALYVSFLLVDSGTFIGFWLAFKVAHGWRSGRELDRHAYSNVFTGNALSILYALVGYAIIILIQKNKQCEALVIAILFIAIIVLIWFILNCIYRHLVKKGAFW